MVPDMWSIYSYFEKGCRKKCTRQSRKVLWVVLSALFFKEIWKNGTGGHGHMFASAKGKQQKYVRQLQSSGTMYWSYPVLPFGIVACTFFPTTFLEAVCTPITTIVGVAGQLAWHVLLAHLSPFPVVFVGCLRTLLVRRPGLPPALSPSSPLQSGMGSS